MRKATQSFKNPARKWLTGAIRKILIPAFVDAGFQVIPLSQEDNRSELGTAYPFGRLRRIHGNFLQIAEIQLASHQSAAFRVSAGVVPQSGIGHSSGEIIPAEDVWTGFLQTHYSFMKYPAFGMWFSPIRWYKKTTSTEEVTDYVSSLATAILPEIEAALATGKTGRHTRKCG